MKKINTKTSIILSLYLVSITIAFFVIITFYSILNLTLIASIYVIITVLSFIYGYIINKNSFGRIVKSVIATLVTTLIFTLFLIFLILFHSLNHILDVILISSTFLILYMLIIILFRYFASTNILHKGYLLEQELTKTISNIEYLTRTRILVYSKYGGDPDHSIYNKSNNEIIVYFNTEYLNMLNDQEIQAVIAHELSHYKSKEARVTNLLYKIPFIFYLYILGYLIVFLIPVRNTFLTYLSIGFLLFLITSFFYVVRKLPLLFQKMEIAADNYSITILNENTGLKNALLKLCDYYNINMNTPFAEIKIKNIKKRISLLQGI